MLMLVTFIRMFTDISEYIIVLSYVEGKSQKREIRKIFASWDLSFVFSHIFLSINLEGKDFSLTFFKISKYENWP